MNPRSKDSIIPIAGSSTRGLTRTLQRRRNRLSAIEPKIGHIKSSHRVGRGFLRRLPGDAINAVLAAALWGDSRVGPRHSWLDMVRQRVYGMLADYENQNDHDVLRSDPIFKVITGRDPRDPQQNLASQPTLSRFENDVRIADLNRLRELFVTLFLQSFRESLGGVPPTRITLDLDA